MKLRLKGDTIRLRLTQGEVERLITAGSVEESTRLGASALRYRVGCNPTAVAMEAGFHDGCIEVRLPSAQALRWSASADAGLTGAVRQLDGSLTTVLIEKDFACLKQRPLEDDDCYPNPAAA